MLSEPHHHYLTRAGRWISVLFPPVMLAVLAHHTPVSPSLCRPRGPGSRSQLSIHQTWTRLTSISPHDRLLNQTSSSGDTADVRQHQQRVRIPHPTPPSPTSLIRRPDRTQNPPKHLHLWKTGHDQSILSLMGKGTAPQRPQQCPGARAQQTPPPSTSRLPRRKRNWQTALLME